MPARAFALVLALVPAAAFAQMYKCVDERGRSNYSDKPCVTGAKGGQVDIQGQPPLSGKLQTPKEDLQRQDTDFKRRQIAREHEAERDRAAQQKRCASLRQEQGRLLTARRVVQTDAKGERNYVDDQARERRLAELQDQLRGCP